MEFFILVFLFCLLIFLGVLYFLASEDFVLFRKDVSMERVFDMALVMAIFSLLIARILYIAFNPSSSLFNPLVFFEFPYFPGFSLTGGVVGGLLAFFLFFARDSEIPKAHLLDFFSISFLATLPFGLLGFLLLSLKNNEVNQSHIIGLIIVYTILFVIFLKFALPAILSGKVKDGTTHLIFLVSFSLISLTGNVIDRGRKYIFNGNIEDIVLFAILIISLVFLFKQEKILTKIKKFRWKRKSQKILS